MEKSVIGEPIVTYGDSDVFHDLGLPNAAELLTKSRLAIAIHEAIKARKLTQVQAARLMGIDQPKVSKIVRGRLTEFSTDWLINCLTNLGHDVDIVIHQDVSSTQRFGTVTVASI